MLQRLLDVAPALRHFPVSPSSRLLSGEEGGLWLMRLLGIRGAVRPPTCTFGLQGVLHSTPLVLFS